MNDARILFGARAFAGAYYLAGYAIECALKACVAKQTREFEFPDKRVVERSYTHNIEQLLDVSGVRDSFKVATAANSALRENWGRVMD